MGEADTVGVIEAAYAAAVAPELWPEALGRLARLFRSHFADVFARNADHTSFSGTAIGLDRRDYEDDFLGIWVKRNVWGSKRPVRMAGEVVSTRQMVPKEELLRSEMYQDYLAPRQLDEGLRLAIAVEDGWIHDISLLRPWSAGPFEAAELDLAGALLPHLQRAAAVSRRLGEAAATAQAGAAALEALRHPVFLLDAAGRALQWNHAATRLLERPGGLSLTGAGMLRAVHAGANVALEAAVARA
ncbi:MAG: PAS domain-containing protein, partial [Rhodospirillales bacterium]|nr:PAS domain-containing protein [Rhodospirillales bacterium]